MSAAIERQATQKAAEALSIDKQWVMAGLIENAEIALGRRKVKIAYRPKTADITIDLEVTDRDAAAANRAIELLGKELGMFIDRKEVRVGALDVLNADDRDRVRDAVRRELERRAGGDRAPGEPRPDQSLPALH